MKPIKNNAIVLSAGLIAALLFGFISAASAGDGSVIATCKLVNKNIVIIDGHESTVAELRWQANKNTVNSPLLQAIQDKNHARDFDSSNLPAGEFTPEKTPEATAGLQNAK